jgi:glycosyltransferase involved in cell wall biosynthesis
VAGLRGGAQVRRRFLRGLHLSRHAARLPQQFDAALQRGGGQAVLGAYGRPLQEASRLKLSIVVPAFNEERLLGAALESIKSAARVFDGAGGWELIVCDNNSTDRTAAIARAAGARVVFEPHNQISRARNRGAAAAAGEWLLFVDADSSPGAELFSDLRSAIEGGCLAGGSTIAADSDSFGFRMGIRVWNAISRIARWGAGAFIYCDAAAFRELRGFSEDLYASEELDFFQRLKALARRGKRKILILHRHPLHTSDRKVHLYSWSELLGFAGRVALHPRRALRNAADCRAWYDGRR